MNKYKDVLTHLLFLMLGIVVFMVFPYVIGRSIAPAMAVELKPDTYHRQEATVIGMAVSTGDTEALVDDTNNEFLLLKDNGFSVTLLVGNVIIKKSIHGVLWTKLRIGSTVYVEIKNNSLDPNDYFIPILMDGVTGPQLAPKETKPIEIIKPVKEGVEVN